MGWIGVDLDGTLAEYDHWRGDDHIGKPIQKMVDRVKGWLSEGKDVRIFTARVADAGRTHITVPVIQDWSEEVIGEILPITNKKDFEMIELWDDRCVQVIPNTGERADGMDELEPKFYRGFTDWDSDDWESVKSNFTRYGNDNETIGPEPDLIFAVYSTPSYDGHADLVFMRDCKWYLVTGSHCSCYGLEGQWTPEEFDPQAHLDAVKEGKRIATFDYDYDRQFEPDLEQKFDKWLAHYFSRGSIEQKEAA